jgi:hypothetical protein
MDGAHVPGFDRRGFLKLSTTAALAISAASTLTMSGCSSADDALIGTYQPLALTPKEFAILSAYCACMVPAKSGTPTPAEAAIAKRIDKELTFHDGSTLLDDIKAALFLIEHLTLASGYWRRFTRLAPAAQATYLAAMSRSDIGIKRDPVNGLRFMALFFYYTDERTWPQIGYTGPMITRKLPEAHNAVETA